MSKTLILLKAHFDSEVCQTVFNDAGQIPRNPYIRQAEISLLEWIPGGQPKVFARLAGKIDRLMVPAMTPVMLRRLTAFLYEYSPQFIDKMPILKSHVDSLTRAVHLSKFMCPDALDRITAALHTEGLAVKKHD